MKLKTKLILSYASIAGFLVAVLIWAYLECDNLFYLLPYGHMYGGMLFFMVAAVLALAVALGASIFFAVQISKPLKLVTGRTQDIAGGSYRDKIDLKTNTLEIDALIVSVNHLAQSLEEQQKLKRRMAQDYSHEFRTPLAAIQSNLEGILDGVFEPTDERIESIRQEIIRLPQQDGQGHDGPGAGPPGPLLIPAQTDEYGTGSGERPGRKAPRRGPDSGGPPGPGFFFRFIFWGQAHTHRGKPQRSGRKKERRVWAGGIVNGRSRCWRSWRPTGTRG